MRSNGGFFWSYETGIGAIERRWLEEFVEVGVQF